jgi:RNA polymerase sigma factor (sigma-70 family)
MAPPCSIPEAGPDGARAAAERSVPLASPAAAELVERCRSGDAAAWDELVRGHRRLVYSVPRRAGLDAAACDDIFQETFAVLLRKLPELRVPEGLPKWLATTARHLTLRLIRRRTREVRRDSPPIEGCDDSAEAAIDRWERRELVRGAFESLGGRCRELLEAVVTSPSPDYRAVSERLGMPIGSIGPTRARCLARLLERLRERGFVDPALEACITKAREET